MDDGRAQREAWIVGATSVLGWTIAHAASPGLSLRPTCSTHHRGKRTRDWLRINVEDPASWAPLRERPPRVLIYCAGVCDVHRCESEPEFARRVNVGGVATMLDALPDATRLVLCSSDHVFAGRDGPYVESTPTDAVSVYGRTRVASEAIALQRRPDCLVVRIGLPIGPSANGRVGHLDWLRYRHAQGLPMTVVDGEHRAAVWAEDAAHRILAQAQSELRGVRHLSATEASPRPELAARLCSRLGIDPKYRVQRRADVPAPHLGRVDLRSEFTDALAAPLPSPLTS